ncbi:hypothetical protein QBC37DRAFT_396540 [Rhypophila decipiens]|uniref:Uncharacterized protein n=1 Tax=Rhypophila decipiens TaxID=261697 RepID=A0AAN6YGL6_9PEZI|nr:hypothetical protein QBC37DRAFT_396540 [Rhypophila decipiens]
MSATLSRLQQRQRPFLRLTFTTLTGVILLLSLIIAPVLSAPIDKHQRRIPLPMPIRLDDAVEAVPQHHPRIPIPMPIRLDDAVEAVPRHAEENEGAESRYGFREHYATRSAVERVDHWDLR